MTWSKFQYKLAKIRFTRKILRVQSKENTTHFIRSRTSVCVLFVTVIVTTIEHKTGQCCENLAVHVIDAWEKSRRRNGSFIGQIQYQCVYILWNLWMTKVWISHPKNICFEIYTDKRQNHAFTTLKVEDIGFYLCYVCVFRFCFSFLFRALSFAFDRCR